jgi:site-specific DNA-methyltransferase (adenine-specific)
VDKLRGNERKVLGKNPNYRPISGNIGYLGQSNFRQTEGMSIFTKGTSEWENWGTALKPALEPITVARKPLSEKNVAENVLKWGTGGMNIDGCRVGEGKGEKKEYIPNNKNNVYGKNMGGGEWDNTRGRFPANLILECTCDEVIEGKHTNIECPCYMLDKQSGNCKSGESGNQYKRNLNYNASSYQFGGRGNTDIKPSTGGASRFFYVAKASKREREAGCEELEEKQTVGGGGGIGDYLKDINSASGKYGSEKAPSKNNHPTVKPIALMEYLIKLVSREGAVVLDPFAGSGTTGMACKKLNRNFILIEREPEYCKIAEKRINSIGDK